MEQLIATYVVSLVSPRRRVQLIVKRLLDLVVASLALLLFSPLLLLIALLIRIESPGPVIYTQPRLGRFGRIFTLYKFRSMQHGARSSLTATARRGLSPMTPV